MQQYQDELRQGNIVGQAITCFFASFLFLRTYLNTPTGLYFGLSIFFLVLAFFLIIAPFIRPLLAMGERVLDYMWLSLFCYLIGQNDVLLPLTYWLSIVNYQLHCQLFHPAMSNLTPPFFRVTNKFRNYKNSSLFSAVDRAPEED